MEVIEYCSNIVFYFCLLLKNLFVDSIYTFVYDAIRPRPWCCGSRLWVLADTNTISGFEIRNETFESGRNANFDVFLTCWLRLRNLWAEVTYPRYWLPLSASICPYGEGGKESSLIDQFQNKLVEDKWYRSFLSMHVLSRDQPHIIRYFFFPSSQFSTSH